MPDLEPVLVGLVAAAAGWLVVWRKPDWIGPVEAMALVLVVVGGLTDVTSAEVAVAVVLILLGGRLPDPSSARDRAIWVGLLVVAALLVGSDRAALAERWLGVVAVIAVLMLVPICRPARWVFGGPAALAMLAWAAASAYLAVPDTEEVTAVGVAACVLAVGVLAARSVVRASGLEALAVLFVWSVMTGARGREASVVVLAAFGVLLLAPWLATRRWRVVWAGRAGLTLVAVHVALGPIVARHAGLGTDATGAALRAGAGVVGALVVALPAALSALRAPAPG